MMKRAPRKYRFDFAGDALNLFLFHHAMHENSGHTGQEVSEFRLSARWIFEFEDGIGWQPGSVVGALIEDAAVDAFAFDICRNLACDALREGLDLPDRLREWVADVLDGTIKRPPLRGRHPMANRARDIKIASAIAHHCEVTGDKPLRNSASKALSGCDIVGQRYGLTYEATAKIWKGRPRG